MIAFAKWMWRRYPCATVSGSGIAVVATTIANWMTFPNGVVLGVAGIAEHYVYPEEFGLACVSSLVFGAGLVYGGFFMFVVRGFR